MARWVLWLLLFLPSLLVAQTRLSFRVYAACEGERPTDIASRFRVSLHDLLQANPNMVADQPLRQGEVVLVPINSSSPKRVPKQVPQKGVAKPSVSLASGVRIAARAYWVYTVQPGDTLSEIAQRFGTTVDAIVAANQLAPPASLTVGQVLLVPVLEQRVETSAPKTTPARSFAPTASSTPAHRFPVLKAPRIFGYVGTVVAPVATIRSAPRRNALAWSQVVRGTQLIVTTEHPGWFGVLMINGATGWVPQSAIRKENRPIFWDDVMRAFGGAGGQDNHAVVAEAMRYLGIPYRYGGTSPLHGLDCSAFVQRVFASRGIRLPRTAAEQAKVGMPVPLSDLRAGDRLYFAVKGNRIDHCGIYIGNGLFIHASGRHNAVVVSSLSEPLYARSLVAIRR
ncbi:MAG: hypothetical protein IMHGJWDQ_000937 [Candidatus Fervidibacter sp.]